MLFDKQCSHPSDVLAIMAIFIALASYNHWNAPSA